MLKVLKSQVERLSSEHENGCYKVQHNDGMYELIRVDYANPVRPRVSSVSVSAKTQHELSKKIDWYF